MKNILLIGIEKIVGQLVAERLVQDGHSLHVWLGEDDSDPISDELKEHIMIHRTESMDDANKLELISKMDLIIHTALIREFEDYDNTQLEHTNINLTRELVNLSLEAQLPKFILLSSVNILKASNPSGQITDDGSKFRDTTNELLRSVQNAELEIWRARAEGLNCCVLSTAIMLDAKARYSANQNLADALLDISHNGNSGTNSLLDMGVLSHCVSAVVASDPDYERIILSSENSSWEEMANMLPNDLKKSKGGTLWNSLLKSIGLGRKSMLEIYRDMMSEELVFNCAVMKELLGAKTEFPVDSLLSALVKDN